MNKTWKVNDFSSSAVQDYYSFVHIFLHQFHDACRHPPSHEVSSDEDGRGRQKPSRCWMPVLNFGTANRVRNNSKGGKLKSSKANCGKIHNFTPLTRWIIYYLSRYALFCSPPSRNPVLPSHSFTIHFEASPLPSKLPLKIVRFPRIPAWLKITLDGMSRHTLVKATGLA